MTIKLDPRKAFIGINAEKADVYIPTNQHCLIAGASNAGKSTMIYNLLAHDLHVARLRPDLMQVWMSDPAGYFTILSAGFARPYATSGQEMDRFWHAVGGELARRTEAFKAIQAGGKMVDNLGPEHGWPTLRIYQDELGAAIKDINGYRRSLLEKNDKLMPFGDDLDYLARTIRKYGMFLVLADQEPKQDSFPVTARRQCAVKIALRFDDLGAARNAIDDKVNQAPAHTIEPHLKGRCYVIGAVGQPKPIEVQGALLTHSEIERLAAKLGPVGATGAPSATDAPGAPRQTRTVGPAGTSGGVADGGPTGAQEPTQEPVPLPPPPVMLPPAAETLGDGAKATWLCLAWAHRHGDTELTTAEIGRRLADLPGVKPNETNVRRWVGELEKAELVERDEPGKPWRLAA